MISILVVEKSSLLVPTVYYVTCSFRSNCCANNDWLINLCLFINLTQCKLAMDQTTACLALWPKSWQFQSCLEGKEWSKNFHDLVQNWY